MLYFLMLLCSLVLLTGQAASAAELGSLTTCSTKVFKEINSTHAWSGKSPPGCAANVAVEKWTDGVQVTSWNTATVTGGWIRTTFAVLMRYAEIADAKTLQKASKDILTRSRKLERCLNSLITVNDPLDCRYKATKEYYAGEKMGIERRWLVWLDDEGRKSMVEYVYGDTVVTPTPPADFFTGQPLPPGTELHILLK